LGAIEPQGHRVGLFGPGGIAKTTLAATAPEAVAFIDLDDSLPIPRPSLGEPAVRRVTAGLLVAFFRASLQNDPAAYAYLEDTARAPLAMEVESK